ncbi:MAG: PfkB family carbohydrate kinase [Ignavibacteriales bacterium]|nr:PfkB family carbohydrate kinase [Ignavibacteriales bacterium]
MILTITLNPLLERRLVFPAIQLGASQKAEKEFYTAGGKGINVSRELDLLSIKNLAFTFLGGNNGRIMKNLLAQEHINFTSIQTKNETREATLVIEENEIRITTFFGPNAQITNEEVDEFKIKLKKMIENCEIVVFSGSSPCEKTDSIFPFGIEAANEFDKISICDTYGKHLQNCIEKSPTIIHNNLQEIKSSLNIRLSEEKEILEYLQNLYNKNIKQVYLTNGSSPVYASNFDFNFKAETPIINEVDSTGSGDAFVAGIIYGTHQSLTFEETLKTAISLGTINAARWDVCNIKLEDVALLKDEIKIETIGKKMRIED